MIGPLHMQRPDYAWHAREKFGGQRPFPERPHIPPMTRADGRSECLRPPLLIAVLLLAAGVILPALVKQLKMSGH